MNDAGVEFVEQSVSDGDGFYPVKHYCHSGNASAEYPSEIQIFE